MEIKQLTSQQIQTLKDKRDKYRSEVINGSKTLEGPKLIELCYQATRLSTWIDIQEGRNDQLKQHLEQPTASTDLSLPRAKRKEGKTLELTDNNGRKGVRYWMPPTNNNYQPGVARAHQQIMQRSKELKQMPRKLNFS
jgi:hypothetical protein